MTATETEFFLFHAGSRDPVFTCEDFLSFSSFAEQDDFLYQLQTDADKAGVQVGTTGGTANQWKGRMVTCSQSCGELML